MYSLVSQTHATASAPPVATNFEALSTATLNTVPVWPRSDRTSLPWLRAVEEEEEGGSSAVGGWRGGL